MWQEPNEDWSIWNGLNSMTNPGRGQGGYRQLGCLSYAQGTVEHPNPFESLAEVAPPPTPHPEARERKKQQSTCMIGCKCHSSRRRRRRERRRSLDQGLTQAIRMKCVHQSFIAGGYKYPSVAGGHCRWGGQGPCTSAEHATAATTKRYLERSAPVS